MNLYRDSLTTGWNAKFLNVILIGLGIALFAWTVSIWMEPAVTAFESTARRAKAPSDSGTRKLGKRASYSLVVNNDIFRVSRKRYVSTTKSVSVKNIVRTSLPAKLTSLTLLGTVILDESQAAIISIRGRENDAKFYKTGDIIGEYTITKINKDSVSLKSGAQVVELPLSQLNGGGSRAYGR